MPPELIVFDIDGTLTRSKLPLDENMSKLLSLLLEKFKVAIISGANFKQFEWQIVDKLTASNELLKNLYLLPVDGTTFCSFHGSWLCDEDPALSNAEKNKIKEVFENVFEKSGLRKPENISGEILEDRGAQFNFSALGQDASIEHKEAWDPDTTKRQKIVASLKDELPDFSMVIGGTTSIEITRVGIDKAYGLKKLMHKLDISKNKVLYIGDKLQAGGNDAPVITLDIATKSVESPEDTEKLILEILT